MALTAPVDHATLLEAALAVAREIVATAVWKDDRCSWVGAMPEEAGAGQMTLTFRALGADLYGGTAGVGLFLAEMAAATDDQDCRRTARAALRHAVSRIDDIPAGARCGLYTGRPGIALALALASRALDDPELDRRAREIVAGPVSPGPEAELDLMAGSAGAIVALLALSRLLEDDTLVTAATVHGEALLDNARHTDTGLCWPSRSLVGAPGLTGLSHGAAGGAVALLELAAVTDEDRYRVAADAAFAYERGLFDPAARNWPDLRSTPSGNGDGQPTFATFWCHGAPGGALARLRALELGGGDELRAEARDALATTEAWVEAALASAAVNYSLCHGLAGNAEILLEGRSLMSTAPSLSHQVAASGIDTYLAQNVPWPSGAYGAATPCLFLGLAGIGRYYLRLARPELPSLLVVRATPAAAGT
ncbi:MAG: lanthionine synthetase LanC family protein [Solirubrobacteraceae bacterium]